MKRWRKWELLGLALLFGLRLFALHSYEQEGWSEHPMVDAAVYWQQAQELAEGADPFSDGYYQPPGYPWFLSQIIHGTDQASLDTVRRVHLALGMFSCWVVMILGGKLGRARGAPWLGLLAGLIYGLYPSTILFEHDVLTPALSTALFLSSMWLLWPRENASLSTVLAGLSGLLLGFAVVVHPTYLIAVVVLIVAVGLGGRIQRRLGPVLALVTCAGFALLPTSHQNHEQFGDFELVSYNSGLNFYLGNGSNWEETHALEAGLPFRRLVLDAEPHRRNVSERNDYWWSRSVQEISTDPLGWLSAIATKAVWSVNRAELPRNEDYRCRTEPGDALHWVSFLPVRYGWIFGLACLGTGVAWRERGRLRVGVVLWISLQLPMIIFLVADRYRLASWPVVALLAALGVHELARLKARWDSGWRPGKMAVGLVVMAGLPWLPVDGRSMLRPADCRYQDGHLALMEGHYSEAEVHYREVLRLQADHMSAHFWLAEVLRREGELEEAAEHLEMVVEWFPQHFKSQIMLGGVYEDLGLDAEEITALAAAYRVPGERTATGRKLVKRLLGSGQEQRAGDLMRANHELAVRKGLKSVISDGLISSELDSCAVVFEVDRDGVPRRARAGSCPQNIREGVEGTALKFRFYPALNPESGTRMEATWMVKVPLKIR